MNGNDVASVGSQGSTKEQIAPSLDAEVKLTSVVSDVLSSRNRPRKILDYALLVKGKGVFCFSGQPGIRCAC